MSSKLLSSLKEIAVYDKIHGGFTIVAQTHHLRKPVGSRLGFMTNKGYLYTRLNKETYPIHHLVWLWHRGYLPKQLDHIDKNKLNNRICNLREASNTLNQLNKGVQRNNTLGLENIRELPSGRYQVRLYATAVGTFNSITEAILVRDSIKNREMNRLSVRSV